MSERIAEIIGAVVNRHRTDEELNGFLAATLDEVEYDLCKAHVARCPQCRSRTQEVAELAMPLASIEVTAQEIARGRAIINKRLAQMATAGKAAGAPALTISEKTRTEFTALVEQLGALVGWVLELRFGLVGATASSKAEPEACKALDGLLDFTSYPEGNNLVVRIRSSNLSLAGASITFEAGEGEQRLMRTITLEANPAGTFVQGILHFSENERRRFRVNEHLRGADAILPTRG